MLHVNELISFSQPPCDVGSAIISMGIGEEIEALRDSVSDPRSHCW